ncbi:Gmad2 immunoglobulin-like domain-containing protein [Nocardioides houyundeii]|uniref:Gmad2 immunoglobulin-like domain-containing protein n=1 Tax=Nocardioides houyundeii TaxID=2045452 RepID=UPI000C78A664|nr:Gmad2 immunoglobulin-like domain-containing protein [Nocardioides houyundeii]
MTTYRSSTATARARRRTSALALLLVGGLALTGCGDDEPEEASDPTPSASTSAPATPTPTPSPSVSEEAGPEHSFSDITPVYYAVESRTGLLLAREPRETGEAGVGAVAAMISGPEDPDYSSTWNPATKVLGITEADGVINVDLSAEARDADVGAPGAELMVQQLVWTVTQLYGDELGVQLLIDGEPAGELWNAVTWDAPVTRTPADEIRAFVGIDTPAEGTTTSSPLTVSGEANAFEATVPWRVLDAQGKEVKSGFTTAEEGMTLSPYSFNLRLPAGDYTIEVAEDDPSGGEGGEPLTDTRSITVK